MKSNESLLKSYQVQKDIFDKAKQNRIQHRNQEIEALRRKEENITKRIKELELHNSQEREFEDFESFRTKAEKQSQESTIS